MKNLFHTPPELFLYRQVGFTMLVRVTPVTEVRSGLPTGCCQSSFSVVARDDPK